MTTHKRNLEAAVGLLRSLSHPVRLSILCDLLHRKEMNVGEIVAARTGAASQSQISQFLGRMKAEGLVTSRKDARTVYYRIRSPEAMAVIKALYKIYCTRN